MDLDGNRTVLDVVQSLKVPARAIHVIFRNGRVIGHSLGEAGSATVNHGDIIALSGPVPFSRGYGAPVV